MYAAAREGVVDVISAYTTDGRIIDYDLAVLADPLQALPPYDAVLLLSPAAARRGELVSALEGFVGSIDDGTMRAANKRVDVDGESPAQAARFLLEAIALPSLAPGRGDPIPDRLWARPTVRAAGCGGRTSAAAYTGRVRPAMNDVLPGPSHPGSFGTFLQSVHVFDPGRTGVRTFELHSAVLIPRTPEEVFPSLRTRGTWIC